jgi:hypothetical protein
MIPDFPHNIRIRLVRLKKTANRAETEQCHDATKNISNQANLILILQGKSGIIKFEFQTT